MNTSWPSNQDEWDAHAKRLQDARVAAIIAKLPEPPRGQWADDEPISPEEEETLF